MNDKPLVVIDAGHGGKDSGALSPFVLQEKEVVLDVAKLVHSMTLQKNFPFAVALTRKDDTFISLNHRANIANRLSADAFVSIHANSHTAPAEGIETWCARQTVNGHKLATSLQESIMQEFPEHIDRGVKRSNFAVLVQTAMPAALVELEFIHTKKGHDHLSDPDHLERYAEAIIAGLLDYFEFEPLPLVKDEDEPCVCAPYDPSDEIAFHANQILKLNKGGKA